ncbi:MAG: tetratricopeptide repeat protein [Candidatus Omnitrophota bacterium]
MSCKKRLALFLCSGALGLILCSCATNSYSLYLKGLLSDRSGDIEEAVAFYRKAQSHDGLEPAFNLQLGLDYIRLKKFKEAVAEFEKAVSVSPDDNNARYVLALLYVQVNDLNRASQHYESLLQKNLNDRRTNIQLRRILFQLYFLDRDLIKARKHCVEVLKLDPVDESGLYLLAMIDNEEGRIALSIDGFKKVLTYYPENADAMNSLAYLYAEQGIELDKAIDLAERAIESEPSNGAYLDTLGWIYFKTGETDKAIEFLESASKLMLDPVILRHLKEARTRKRDDVRLKEDQGVGRKGP